MDRFFNLHIPKYRCKASPIILALVFFLGHLLGICFSFAAGDSFFLMMRGAVFGSVSIVGLFSAVFFPFLLSAVLVYCRRPILLLIPAFFKAFVFAWLACGILTCFAGAGWLVCALMLFGDFGTMPLLCWYWLRHISGEIPGNRVQEILILSLLFLIGCVNYCLVAPFLATVLTM